MFSKKTSQIGTFCKYLYVLGYRYDFHVKLQYYVRINVRNPCNKLKIYHLYSRIFRLTEQHTIYYEFLIFQIPGELYMEALRNNRLRNEIINEHLINILIVGVTFYMYKTNPVYLGCDIRKYLVGIIVA